MPDLKKIRQVVVVEGEDRPREQYAGTLAEDHEVIAARTAGEAMRNITEETDAVFLDRGLPDTDGDNVLREIRGRGLDTYVALVTGRPAEDAAAAIGFDAYLTKPASGEDLRGVLEYFEARQRHRAAFEALLRSATTRGDGEGHPPEELQATLRSVEADLREQVASLAETDVQFNFWDRD
jgi:DNA-binding response OmpR family regulator